MNTADRSVEALDTALRRRFSFIEMMPEYDLYDLEKEIEGIKLSTLLSIINRRIEKLLDRDHQIGHSYLLKIKDIGGLQLTFKDKIIPLLQEYFYADYEKIGLILGDGFISAVNEEKTVFANFVVEDIEVYDKPVYHIKEEPFKSIDEFKIALKSLINI